MAGGTREGWSTGAAGTSRFAPAYTHIFIKDNTAINISAASSNPVFDPRSEPSSALPAWVDIFSVGLRYHFAPPATAIVRKG